MGEGKEKPPPPSPDVTEKLDELREEIVCGPGDVCQSMPPPGRGGILDQGDNPGETEPYYPPQPLPPEETGEDLEESEKPIDPGKHVATGKTLEERFPEVARIIHRLEEISNEEFFAKDQALIKYVEGFNWDKIEISWDNLKIWKASKPWWKIANPELRLVVDMAERMDEAMFYKAVTNGWSEKTLYEQHKKAMYELYRECFDRGYFRTFAEWGKSAWLDIFTKDTIQRPPCWNIENTRRLKVKDRDKMFKNLTNKIARKFRKLGFADNGYCIKWNHGKDQCDTQEDEDKFNPDIIKFIHERAIPFYAYALIDEAIVENSWEERLERKFKDTLANLYSSAQI